MPSRPTGLGRGLGSLIPNKKPSATSAGLVSDASLLHEVLETHERIMQLPVEKVFAEVSKAGNAVRNNGGGFYNHVLFWNNLGKGSTKPSAELSAAINKAFGSFDKMKEGLGTASKTHFGSGWGWLYLTPDKNLAIGSTPNQDNPLMDISSIKGIPLLTIDVWEHAYYLKYQNKRADFVDNIWNIINWDEVSRRYQQAMK